MNFFSRIVRWWRVKLLVRAATRSARKEVLPNVRHVDQNRLTIPADIYELCKEVAKATGLPLEQLVERACRLLDDPVKMRRFQEHARKAKLS